MFPFIMHGVHVRDLDLNLLPVLDALLAERHLTRASRRLGPSQSATSHALGRLRETLGDPPSCAPRAGWTHRAGVGAGEPLRDAMASLTRTAPPPTFDLATARGTFSIATADYGAYALLPTLMERVAREAPQVDIWVRPVADNPAEQLARGEVDALLAPMFGERPAALHLRKLFDERFVGIARRGHPLLRDGTMSLDDWTSVGHVFIAPRGRPGGVVDTVLAQRGLHRRVSLAVPQFLLAPHVVTRTDLVGVLGARLAESLAASLPLALFDPPVPLPGFTTHLVWHARLHDDPGQRWFRRCVRESVQPRVASEAR
ncbi:MAG: LysR family transcriptional regulator [Polyangiales bacterium]